MQFYGCSVQDVSGEIYPLTGPTGKPFTFTVPAARFDQWKAKGAFEQMNAALNQLD